jgi:hypothetical protein
MQHLNYEQLTLEEFEERFPYKVGDKVIIKAKNQEAIIDKVVWCCDTIIYWLKYDGCLEGNWRVEHLQPYKEETMERKYYNPITLIPVLDKVMIIPTDEESEIVQENNKFYLVKKQSKYPKTYEECCIVLQDACMTHKGGYKGNLIQTFQKLLICRDVYRKIADDWEPDWEYNDRKYTIFCAEGKVEYSMSYDCNHLLTFPTEEMRDAFYNNFKELIEECKELL